MATRNDGPEAEASKKIEWTDRAGNAWRRMNTANRIGGFDRKKERELSG